MALFPGELWSFQVIRGLEVEDASPAFRPGSATSERVQADGLDHRAGSSPSPMTVALSRDCGVGTFYRGNHGCGNLLCATRSLWDLGQVFRPLSKPHSLACKMVRLGRIVSIQ